MYKFQNFYAWSLFLNLKSSIKFMGKFSLLIILIIGGLFFTASSILALTISPPIYELGAFPGQEIVTGLKIYNETEESKTFYFESQNFRAKENEGGEPVFASGDEKGGLASWVEFPFESMTLKPGEKGKIDFKIKVPKNADPGGHYAVIFLSSSLSTGGGGAVGVASKIGALVLLRVEGDVREEGKLAEFSLKDKKTFYEHLPIDFLVRVENTGTVHIKPAGKIKIKNLLGQTKDEILVNIAIQPNGEEEPVGNILPQSIRRFENSWKKGEKTEAPNGFFEKVKYEKDNFALGRYKADLSLEYGKDKKVIYGSLIFWVLPWHLLLVVVAIGIILIILIIFAIKKYNQWIIKKAQTVNPK